MCMSSRYHKQEPEEQIHKKIGQLKFWKVCPVKGDICCALPTLAIVIVWEMYMS